MGQPVTRAYVVSGYKWRLGIIALACLGFAGWFFYDGAVAYPHQKELYERRLELSQSSNPDWKQEWDTFARERGWRPDVEPPRKTDTDIMTQYLMGFLVLPLGLFFGFHFLRWQNRWIAGDEDGLHTSWGQHAPWTAIRALDKSRWKSKGIAVVRYVDDAGTERRITLDDWKYERQPTIVLFEETERRIGGVNTEAETPSSQPDTPEDEPS